MSNRVIFLNCYQDLQRAATSLYLNPDGKTHKVFLDHALKILAKLKEKRASRFEKKLLALKHRLSETENSKKIADELLTIGLLLKPAS